MEYIITKVDVAVDQLDWSIRLFLDQKAYVPAITLAGAAEEIVGATLGGDAVFARLKEKLSADFNLPPEVISQQYLNKTKNWLKHWSQLRDEEKISVDLEAEAVQYLVRALANLALYDNSLPSEGPRFFAWVAESRRDLDATKWNRG